MLYLPRQDLETLDDLHKALHNAIALELGTIPPYLTALFSIKPGKNAAAGAIIRSVVIEEMLHLSLACNMLNAVGGQPDIPGALLHYPSPLPMGIGDTPGHEFIVGLCRLSQASIQTFMTIEEPEHPLEFPGAGAGPTEYHTIGEFYAAVGELMTQLGPGIFTGHPDRQVSGWIGTNELSAIDSLEGALAAITTIVDQGEGTTTSPADAPDELAHYYRFEQIQRHATLNPDPSAPEGYAWGAPAIALDDSGVWPMVDNPTHVPLPEGSEVARVAHQFDATFTGLIDELQRTFDGTPEAFGAALAQMYALRLEAAALVPLEIPGRDKTAGPRFMYLIG